MSQTTAGHLWSSPHGRGCFHLCRFATVLSRVFPARAGVFPSGVQFWVELFLSSPHGRGCFQDKQVWRDQTLVFPARAGVFPTRPSCRRARCRLPRTGGGVSCTASEPALAPLVFPARAGVFLETQLRSGRQDGLPRTGGGVSIAGVVGRLERPSSPHGRGCF